MHFLNQIHNSFHLFSLLFLLFLLKRVIFTNATHFSMLNWSQTKMQTTSLLNTTKNATFFESHSLNLENMLLQQMVKKEENYNQDDVDNINGIYLVTKNNVINF